MTLRRCQSCRTMYDKKAGACTSCGAEPYPLSRAVINQRWASNLNAQAEHAVKHT